MKETEPRALAVTVALLERAARLVADHPSVERLIVLDYRGGETGHHSAVEAVTREISVSPEMLDLDNGGYVANPGHKSSNEDVLAMLL